MTQALQSPGQRFQWHTSLKAPPLSWLLPLMLFSASCGSEAEKDRQLADGHKDEDDVEVLTRRKEGDAEAKKKPDIRVESPIEEPDPQSPIDAQSCSALAEFRVQLDPATGRHLILLTAPIPDSCFENAVPILRMKIEYPVTLGTHLWCEDEEIGEFNFICTGTIEQFLSGGTISIPISAEHELAFVTLRAEFEFVQNSEESIDPEVLLESRL